MLLTSCGWQGSSRLDAPLAYHCVTPSHSQAVRVCELSNGQLLVWGESERHSYQSVKLSDINRYRGLMGDARVAHYFGDTREPWPTQQVEAYLRKQVSRRQQHNPWHALKIIDKQTGAFIGHLVAGYGYEKGELQIAFALLPQYWREGRGKESANFLVHQLVPTLVAEGWTLPASSVYPEAEVRCISATTDPENRASQRVLASAGLQQVDQPAAYQGDKLYWSVPLSGPS